MPNCGHKSRDKAYPFLCLCLLATIFFLVLPVLFNVLLLSLQQQFISGAVAEIDILQLAI